MLPTIKAKQRFNDVDFVFWVLRVFIVWGKKANPVKEEPINEIVKIVFSSLILLFWLIDIIEKTTHIIIKVNKTPGI